MRDGFVLAESDLVDFLSGSTDSAINFSGTADLHTPIHPPPEEWWLAVIGCMQKVPCTIKSHNFIETKKLLEDIPRSKHGSHPNC